jgi:hypothetical protein
MEEGVQDWWQSKSTVFAENWILIKLNHKYDFARKKSDLNNSKIL